MRCVLPYTVAVDLRLRRSRCNLWCRRQGELSWQSRNADSKVGWFGGQLSALP